MRSIIQNVITTGQIVTANNDKNNRFFKDRACHSAVATAAAQILADAKKLENERAKTSDLVQKALDQTQLALGLFNQGNYMSPGEAKDKCVRVQELLTDALKPLA